MSVVAVRVNKNKDSTTYHIASDSISVVGWTQRKGDHTSFSKLFRVDNLVVGTCGLAEEGSLLRVWLETHKLASAAPASVVALMSEFAAWKGALSDEKKLKNSYIFVLEKKGDSPGGVVEFNAWHAEEVLTFSAIGAGMDFALASLHLGHRPDEAVGVACNLSVFCEFPVCEELGDL